MFVVVYTLFIWCKQVSHGVAHAAKLYPHSYLVQVLVGTAKGAGTGIVRPIEQVCGGVFGLGRYQPQKEWFYCT